jgi:scyllo-inositol 2-dehydrogenase (NADP+)
MAPIRLAVIGAGLIWKRTHRPILTTMGDMFAPVAFADLSEERRAEAAREFPGAPVLSDHRALLALPGVDAALVLTPIASNAPVALDALLAGKDVIMEKPIARSVAEGRELLATARRLGRRIYVTEQLAYRSAERILAALIAAGEIGELVMWDQVQHLEGDKDPGPLRYESTPWRKQADFPLGTLFDGGIHLIAALSTVFGAPAAVAATGRKLRPEYGEYDQVAALFQYAGGAVGVLSHSSYLPPDHNHFHVRGTAGTIVVEQRRLLVTGRDRPERVIELPQEDAYRSMWLAIGEAARQGAAASYTPERALHDVATLEAVDRAIKSGGRAYVAPPVADSGAASG